MQKRKKGSRARGIGLVGAAVVLASAFTILGASPASAGAPPPNSGQVCIYEHEHWGGASRCWSEAALSARVELGGTGWNDKASSISNQTGKTICFYVGSRGNDGYEALGAGHWLEYLTRNPAPNGGSWNDKITSLSLTPCGPW
jgi:Peptidase inhibitor family I36